MKEYIIFGTIEFADQFDKRKKVNELKNEFGQNLRYWVDNQLISYESSVFQY